MPRRGYRFIAHVKAVNNNGVAEIQVEASVKPVARHQKIWGYPVAIAATLLVVFAGSILWKLANKSGRNLSELVAALPLNLEKLTASGQSNPRYDIR